MRCYQNDAIILKSEPRLPAQRHAENDFEIKVNTAKCSAGSRKSLYRVCPVSWRHVTNRVY